MGLRLKDFKKHCFRSCHTDHRGLWAEMLCILSEELSRREASRPLQYNSDHCHHCCGKQGNEPQAAWPGPQHGPVYAGDHRSLPSVLSCADGEATPKLLFCPVCRPTGLRPAWPLSSCLFPSPWSRPAPGRAPRPDVRGLAQCPLPHAHLPPACSHLGTPAPTP